MTIPRDPLAIAVMVAALAALAFVAGSCIGLLVAYAKRAKVVWGRGMRAFVGLGGTATALVVLLLPPGVAWLVYLRSVAGIDAALAMAPSAERVGQLSGAIDSGWAVMCAAGLADAVLLVPCAVLAGLSLSVPFFLRGPDPARDEGR